MDLKKLLPENGPPIKEVSKYIEKYKNELIVIKYGGNVFIDREIFNNFINDLKILNELKLSIIVVHGGGPRIKRELDKSKITYASTQINYQVEPGSMIFFPSYMPHQYVVDMGYEPFRFIHWNCQAIPKAVLNA